MVGRSTSRIRVQTAVPALGVVLVVLVLPVFTAVANQPAELFVTADSCTACHNGLLTPAGEDVSIASDWRASMMAHAARDPYWQASLRREVLERPAAQAAIENECGACHMPMTRFEANAAGGKGQVFSHLPAGSQQTRPAQLAADGVSCTLCHQIQGDGLGERSSFTAGFAVDTETPAGKRPVYGPYQVDAGRQTLMRSASRFVPSAGMHLQGSELCATCHTLFTHALDDSGAVIGELPEQVPYLEWLHSAYPGVRSCQSCHMPEVDEETAITSVMGIPRPELSRHVFRGGNFLMPKIFERYRQELGVRALPTELETMSRRTAEHLGEAAAELSIDGVQVTGDTLELEIVLGNLAGHKLPTAYPSRRTWIHLVVHNAGGAVLFESGRLAADGSINGNDNDRDPGRYEPHYDRIDSPEQVQIYETIMGDGDAAVTTVLLSGVRYLKDNRIPPAGFDKTTAAEEIAVQGKARDDNDFGDGEDRVGYSIALRGAAAGLTVTTGFTITAELWYQPIGYRWAHNLEQRQAAEISRFVTAYNELSSSSAVLLAHSSEEIR